MAVEKSGQAEAILAQLTGIDRGQVDPSEALDFWTMGNERVADSPITVFLSPASIEEFKINGAKIGEGDLAQFGWFGEDMAVVPRVVYQDGATVAKLEIEGLTEKLQGRGVNLIVSIDDENVLGAVLGAARWMKEVNRASSVTVIASRLCGLRQDGIFESNDKIVPEPPTAYEVIDRIASTELKGGGDVIDKLIVGEAHSGEAFEYANWLGLQMIGLTGYKWAADQLGYKEFKELPEEIRKRFRVAAPDKNRHQTANSFADELGLEVIQCKKCRDKFTGELSVENGEQMEKELEGVEEIFMFDDEIQTGSTSKLILDLSLKLGIKVTVIAMHANFVGNSLENLNHPALKELVVTDAMMPPQLIRFLDQAQNINVRILQTGDSLARVGDYLWKGDVRGELPDGWKLDPWFRV